MYQLAAIAKVGAEPFPTLFYTYTPNFDPAGGRSFPAGDVALARIGGD